MALKPNEAIATVFGGEAANLIGAMLRKPPLKVVRHSCVEDTDAACKDVRVIRAPAHRHQDTSRAGSRKTCSWLFRAPQEQQILRFAQDDNSRSGLVLKRGDRSIC